MYVREIKSDKGLIKIRRLTMHNKVPKAELKNRMNSFISAMDEAYANWEVCVIVGDMSMYYLTGTICNGVLFLNRGKESILWVRKSFERAKMESEFEDIRPMSSFRDIASNWQGDLPKTLYLDMSATTLEWYGYLSKYMKFEKLLPIDNIMLKTRSVKSEYEISLMKEAGKIIDRLFMEALPPILYDGISEAELGAQLYSIFIKNGYHGVSRFSMRNADVVLGHIGFAESSLYPSVFNGASGLVGLCPAAPVLGSRDVKLKDGDLVYVDIGFGIDGYNVDKTIIYSYKKPQPEYVNEIHSHCLELERKAASMLRCGVKPSDIYDTVYSHVKPELRDCFMGTKSRTVPFLGHGVGLFIDEYPVIAKGFNEPLQCGMTLAIEPKIGISGVGMTGSENTYLITEEGAVSLTGPARDIVLI